MPRGRPKDVRYFYDEAAGNVIAVRGKEVSVLSEVTAAKKARKPKEEGAAGSDGAPADSGEKKPRGRPKKKKPEAKPE